MTKHQQSHNLSVSKMHLPPINSLFCFLLLVRKALSWTPNYPSYLVHSRIIATRVTHISCRSSKTDDNDSTDETDAWYENLDVLLEDGDDLYEGDTAEDWISDSEKSKKRRPKGSELIPAKEVLGGSNSDSDDESSNKQQTTKKRPSPYTEEEEELITAMGGKDKKRQKTVTREIGFLGDSTLREISTDYSVRELICCYRCIVR
ncbi:MAG: hypothetical protein ACI8RD_003934 [Bacillariaceae sp.]